MSQRLTDNERQFLRLAARTDDLDDRVAAYREMKCEGYKLDDATVKGRITRLMGRLDADFFIKTERERIETEHLMGMRKADGAAFDTVVAREAVEQAMLQTLERVIRREDERLRENPKRGPSGFAKACEVAQKVISRETVGKPLTQEQRLALVHEREKRLAAAQKPQGEAADTEAVAVLEGAGHVGTA